MPTRHGTTGSLPVLCCSLFALALTGCAAALPNAEWPDRGRVLLAPDSLAAIEGLYEYVGASPWCRTAETQEPCPAGFLDALSGSRAVHEIEPESGRAVLGLSVVDRGRLRATVYLRGEQVHEEVLNGRINGRGYFEVSPTTRLVSLRVPIVWGPRTEAVQLGVGADGSLLVEYSTNGLLFLVAVPFFVGSHASTYYFPTVSGSP